MPGSLLFRFFKMLWIGFCCLLIVPGYSAEMRFDHDWASLGDSGADHPPFSVGYLQGRVNLLLSRPAGVVELLSIPASRQAPVTVARFSAEEIPLATCSGDLLDAPGGNMLLCGPTLRRIVLGDDQSITELPALTAGMSGADRYFKRFGVRHMRDGRALVAAVGSRRIVIWERREGDADFHITHSARVPWDGMAAEPLAPSVAELPDTLHVLFSARVPSSDQSIALFNSRFLHLARRKTDSTWRVLDIERIPRTPNNILSEAVLARGDGRLYLGYVIDSSMYVQSANDGLSWSKPQRLYSCAPKNLQAFSGRKAALFWIDDCFQKHEWWARLPFSSLVPKGRSNWLNNDVMTRLLSLDGRGEQADRITRELSYTDRIAVVPMDASGFFILRSGRKKVGYQLDSYNYTNEYFFRWGNLSDPSVGRIVN